MKRDMDLVRAILIACEKEPDGYPADVPSVEGYSTDQVAFHIYLMGEAGLLRVFDTTTIGSTSPSAAILSITWKGYDFLDASRSSVIWDGTKKALSKMGGAGFEVWIDVLKYYGRQKLKDFGVDLPVD